MKCIGCGTVFDRPATSHGARCLPCNRAYLAVWRAKRKALGFATSGKASPERRAETNARYYARPDVKRRRADNMQRYQRADSPLRARHLARWQLQRAVASGRIVKQPCEVCMASHTQAHHDDYSKPLAVRWLCAKHHRDEHAAAKGA